MKAVYSLAATGSGVLPWNQTLIVLGITAVTILLVGLIVILGRRGPAAKSPDQSVVRSWIAMALVAGLLLFCALTFAVSDSNLQNTLFGGLTASVGAAVAFYFSSKSADQARQDILNATFGTETVPDLTGLTEDQATALLGKTSLRLEVSPDSSTDATATVKSQQPPKDSVVRKGSSVVITLPPPPSPPALPQVGK